MYCAHARVCGYSYGEALALALALALRLYVTCNIEIIELMLGIRPGNGIRNKLLKRTVESAPVEHGELIRSRIRLLGTVVFTVIIAVCLDSSAIKMGYSR